MSYLVQLKELPPSVVLRVRSSVPAEQIGEAVRTAFAQLTSAAVQAGLDPVGPTEVTYLRQFRPGEVAEIEADLPVSADPVRAGVGGLVRRPGRIVAHVFHKGPYEDITGAYQALIDWIQRTGHRTVGHPTEVYLVGPNEDPLPENYLTEVVIPVE
ncbi:effector-binding domain-containing protein [Kutzneria viridogrisea]|uniref:Effector-binding domain-containing protein n=1 Tax=Kutzneria viridogrisea TaxID=47990 RepID=A0ABR6BZF6_9PSEU|nr:GyrI-like domain-containing protein [Kutzneria albida]MBA8932016.1 effector-binding domain-containing protein [Kutzneria viridogrisea]